MPSSSPNPNSQAPEPDYVELPTRDTTTAAGLESPSFASPEFNPSPRSSSAFQNLPHPHPHANANDYLRPMSTSTSTPLNLNNPRDSFMAPAPSFMSLGRASRHDSYSSDMGSEKGFAGGVGSKRGSYASGTLAGLMGEEEGRRGDAEGAGAGVGLGAGAGAAGVAGVEALGWRNDPHGSEAQEKPRWMNANNANTSSGSRKKKWIILGSILGVLVVGLGVGLGVGLWKRFDNQSDPIPVVEVVNGSTTTRMVQPTSTSSSPRPTGPTFGSNGSLVKLTNGTEVTYINPHGGNWAYDPTDPLLNSARPNSWTPPLNTSWNWDQTIHGVNVGGWFVTEPFIVPGLYEAFPSGPAGVSIDEYTLSQNMGSQLEAAMTEHYETFITEQDFMQMAAAGLTWVRIPIGFWALETHEGEPFLEGVAWRYIVRALGWCRKYGLRVNLDLHATPGSQNGWNHSGRLGRTNWMYGTMGLANLQRSLDIIETLLEFIMQPEWKDIVPMFGILNEPRAGDVTHENLGSFYLHMHERFRNITGVGEGNGPILSVFEGFEGVSKWYGWGQGPDGTGPDRVMLDVHQYTVFQAQDPSPILDLSTKGCDWWYNSVRNTTNRFGLYNTGEWSLAWNDCGQWVNAVNAGTRWENTHVESNGRRYGSCEEWMRPEQWNSTVIAAMKNIYMSGVDALQSNFFWTWKIGSTAQYANPAPNWSYKLGLELGWIPNDPREADGFCQRQANLTPQVTFTGYQPFMTGGVGAGQIPASVSLEYPWPLTTMAPDFNAADMSRLYQYTRTAPPLTVPSLAPSYSGLAESVSSQLVPTSTYPAQAAFTPVADCAYPDIYSAWNLSLPATSACGAGQAPTDAYFKRAVVTPAPRA